MRRQRQRRGDRRVHRVAAGIQHRHTRLGRALGLRHHHAPASPRRGFAEQPMLSDVRRWGVMHPSYPSRCDAMLGRANVMDQRDGNGDMAAAMPNLDPTDWSELRALGHRMLDDMFDHLATLRDGPVWRQMPTPARQELRAALPREPADPAEVYARFQRLVLPYATGNLHPGFMGWVHGGGSPVGMLAEFLAGALNANLGGRDHAPIEVERQVIAWAAEMLGFPPDASGLLVTGTSIANLIGLLVARTAALSPSVRAHGVGGAGLTAYTSAAAHGCIPRAMEISGLGHDALRLIPCDAEGRIRLAALHTAIAADRLAGM